jgi:hypothetical protein
MKALGGTLCAVFALALASPGFAADTIIRNFTAGAGPSSVGIVAAGEDSEDDGPQAIYAGENGDVYLLDQVNGRVLQLDPDDPTKEAKVLELPPGMQPTDIIVDKDTIYAWDGQIHALQATGDSQGRTRSLSLTRGIEAPDETVANAFAQMGSEPASAADDADSLTRSLGSRRSRGRSKQTISTYGRGAITAEVTPFAKDSGVQINIRPKGSASALAHLKLQVRSRLGDVEVLNVDKQGRIFVLAENIGGDFGAQSSAFVARYAPTGALEGIYELPLTSAVALSRRFVTVAPDGDVYFLRNQKAKTDVLGVGFRHLKNAKVIDPGPPQPDLTLQSLARFRGAHAAVRPLTRAQVIETGMAFANIRWRVNPGAYGPDPDTGCTGFRRVRRPGYLHGKMNQEVQGIPYCWGCMGSLPQIASNIQRGVKAGNICTRNDPRPDVTGVDCSAFVSATWGLATHFTTIAIPSITKPVDPFDLLPGDALNKPGSHVMLFVRFTPDKKVEVLEASTGGCNGKVCRNVYPLGSLLARGYRPVRYRGLAADTSSPTAGAIAKAAEPPKSKSRRRR